MESEEILIKISSKFIFQKIFEYIKDNNYKFKLFNHSKYIQQKLNISLIDYQYNYFEKIGININDFLYNNKISDGVYDKNELSNNLKNDLINNYISINIFQKWINNYVKTIPNNSEKYKDKMIVIYSPFFEVFSKTAIFEKLHICISLYKMEFFKNDYISIFNKFNKEKIKYPSLIFYFFDDKDIDYIKELKINYNQIQKFKIIHNNSKHFSIFCKSLFTIINLAHNLIQLSIDNIKFQNEIKTDLIEDLNNFKILENLKLKGFYFNTIFTLKLKNLKKLYLSKCKNISFEEDCHLNLRILELEECKLIAVKSQIKFPNLEEFKNFYDDNEGYNLIIDFKSFNNIKVFEGEANDFLCLENPLLEKISLKNSSNQNLETEIILLEKLISIKSLKNIKIKIYELYDDILSEFQGQNSSVTELDIFWKNRKNDCILFNLQKIFPNVSKLIFSSSGTKESSLEIKENINYKVNEIFICNTIAGNIKLYIESFKNLKSIKIITLQNLLNKPYLPMFCSNNKIIFKSLKNFFFYNLSGLNIKLEILKNIYNNIDNMPNLKHFLFYCYSEEITIDFYKIFIIKLLSLNLNSIFLKIKGNNNESDEKYLLNELKQLYPKMICYNFQKINIYKLK